MKIALSLGFAATVAAASSVVAPSSASAAQALMTGRYAQNASECVGGYRMTHVVRSQGRTTGGVLLRCGPRPAR